jgi:hypothetical protein
VEILKGKNISVANPENKEVVVNFWILPERWKRLVAGLKKPVERYTKRCMCKEVVV